MPAHIPNLGTVSNLGGQFQGNVFASAEKHFTDKSKQYAQAHTAQIKQTAANREKFAKSAMRGVQQGRTKFAQSKMQQQQAQKAAKAHAAGVKSGRVAPAPGAAPRTFAMAPTKQQKAQARTMQQQRNFAHGEALKFQQAQFKTMQSQRNFAHNEALKENKQRSKMGGTVNTTSSPKAPSLNPAFSSPPTTHTSAAKPQGIATSSFSSQFTPQKSPVRPQGSTVATFSSGSPATAPARSGSVTGPQFPQHVHPEGSSTAPLPNLTAAQPKPNVFTTGSRNAKPGGIAARGSQLEAWAMGRQQQIRQQRGNQ